jgi:hypothetical protein
MVDRKEEREWRIYRPHPLRQIHKETLMKKNVTYIAQNKFVAIAEKHGLKLTEQAGFIRVELEGKLDHRLYIPKTKTVGRIDLAGFTPKARKGFKILGEGERFGAVHAQLDFSQTEGVILDAFSAACQACVSLPPLTEAERDAAKKARGRKAGGGAVAKEVAKPSNKKERLAALKERISHINQVKEVAAKMGATVAPVVEEQLATATAQLAADEG